MRFAENMLETMAATPNCLETTGHCGGVQTTPAKGGSAVARKHSLSKLDGSQNGILNWVATQALSSKGLKLPHLP